MLPPTIKTAMKGPALEGIFSFLPQRQYLNNKTHLYKDFYKHHLVYKHMLIWLAF